MLKELFVKDIYRDINGVIQAGQLDEARIAQELDEYVVTAEIAEHLEDLLEHYVKSLSQPTDKIGVWISGFFGSGKSHFLKIVSYLLGQAVAHGKPAVEYFREKNLPPRLMELIEQASRHKAATLLFNIEAKTAVGVRGTRQNIVEVFLRVFNEYLGYSETLWIAEIEHTLAQEGKLTAFHEAVRRVFGREWHEVRDAVALRRKQFVAALQEIGYDEASADAFLRIAQQNFSITPEQFARRVAAYCRAQGPEFRLIFLVDEIGQYIGDDRELMLNLQTVVEQLGTHGQGQIWVMVTSQESIDMVTNVRGREYDFSKIQGRFRTRINLSSTNTDDVIKWRILQKTDVAAASLQALYDQNEQSIRNMLLFDADTQALKAGYRSSKEFAEAYPFQPYQFELLQKVFEKVRKQGEAGKSLSHGERSLLNAFQDALIQLDRAGSEDVLAPFWLFYDTIETFLDGPVKSTVRRAASRDDLTELDVRVLKVLYLIKNITEVKSTVANVTTLLIDGLGVIRRDLEQQVQTSLDRLVRHNLVALNADGTYSFLSDEEQEINREIAAVRIDDVQLAASLGDIFFTEVCPKKHRAANGRDFDFNKRFDTYLHGAQREKLTFHVLTSVDSETARMKSLESGVLIMWIPPTITDYRDAMERSLQIEQYARRDRSGLSDSQRRILDDKQQREALEFRNKAKTLLVEACKQAAFYVFGQEQRYNGAPETQIERALAKLIANTYTHLDYIDHPLPISQETRAIVDLARHGAPPTLTGRANELALQAVQQFLDERDRQHLPTTLEDVVAHFTDPPYGWVDRDIVGLIAVLLHDGQVRLSYLGETLGPDTPQFAERMLRPAERSKVVVKLLREVPADVQGRIRNLLNSVFEEAPSACDSYDALADFIRQQLNEKWAAPLREVIQAQSHPPQAGGVIYRYPDEALAKCLQTEVLRLLAIRDSESLVHELLQLEDELGEWAEQVTRLRNFFKHPRDLFDQAVRFLNEHHGEWAHLVHHPEVLAKKDAIESILRDPNPYQKIPSLPRLVQELRVELTRVLDERRNDFMPRIQEVLARIEEIRHAYESDDEIHPLADKAREQVEGYLEQLVQETRLSALAGYVTYAQDALSQLYREIQALLDKRRIQDGEVVKDPGGSGVAGQDDSGGVITVTRREVVITLENLPEDVAPRGDIRMESREALDAYLSKIGQVLQKVLGENGIVIIRGR
jgi:hypothetical protein